MSYKKQELVDKEFDAIFQLPENVVIPSRLWLDEKIKESKKHIAQLRKDDLESITKEWEKLTEIGNKLMEFTNYLSFEQKRELETLNERIRQHKRTPIIK